MSSPNSWESEMNGNGYLSDGEDDWQGYMPVNNLTALVVDNNSVQRLVYNAFLRNFGVECEMVLGAQAAFDIHRVGSSFDLILIDMDLPGINGPQATRTLRTMGVESMIVGIYFGSRQNREKQMFEEAGADDTIKKPLTPGKLVRILRQIDDNI